MASAEIPNSSPDAATNPAAAGPDLSSSPLLPLRKRRLSRSQSPTRSASRSRSPRGRRSRSRSRSPQYPPDGKRRRHNNINVEACRDFLRDRCTRSDLDCRYAHPHNSVSVDRDNKRTACAEVGCRNSRHGAEASRPLRRRRWRSPTEDQNLQQMGMLFQHFNMRPQH